MYRSLLRPLLFRLPPETAHHLATAAMLQISAELSILEDSLCEGDGCALNSDILRRVISGLAERARAAAEVAGRIHAGPVAEQIAAARKGMVQP